VGATYFYNAEDAIFVTSYWGRTSIAEGNAMRQQRAADPARSEARAHIIDLSEFEGTDLSPDSETEIFRALGILYPQTFSDVPTIVVASRPQVFGQARIFETTVGLQPSGPGVKVVRSWKEAEKLVGADLTQVRDEIRKRQTGEPPA
jgi:hypothetical protein